MTKIVLCGKKGCCPTIDKKDGEYIITDDYGGIVHLTEAEMKMLKESDLSIF